MEPMALGSPSSPTTAPANPFGQPAVSNNQQQYLPPYLMGESTPASTGSLGFSLSPTKLNQVSNNPNSPFNSPTVNYGQSPFLSRHNRFSQGGNTSCGWTSTPQPSDLRQSGHTFGPNVQSGPPTQGLFEGGVPRPLSSLSSSAANSPATSLMSPALRSHGLDISSQMRDCSTMAMAGSFCASPSVLVSPAVHDGLRPNNVSVNDYSTFIDSPKSSMESTWVTVFGFPPSAASLVLQQFTALGTVLERKIGSGGPSGCNWMHLKYATPLQARRALSRNGKVVADGSIMVGVVPCTDQSILSPSAVQDKENVSSVFPSPTATLRPLTQAYKAAQSEHEVTPKTNIPQKSNSLVSRAMDFMFGW